MRTLNPPNGHIVTCLALLVFSIFFQSLSLAESGASRGYSLIVPEPGYDGVNISEDIGSDAVLFGVDPASCPKPYESLPGLDFCLQANTSISIINNAYYIDGWHLSDCPQSFHRAPNSTICAEENLSLALLEDRSVRMVLPQLDCPDGMYANNSEKRCIGGDGGTELASNYVAPNCYPDFMKPPGEFFCVSFEIALSATDISYTGIIPASEPCPGGMERKQPGGYCLPKYKAYQSGPGCNSVNTGMRIEKGCDCEAGQISIISRIPLYNEDSEVFAAEQVVMCYNRILPYSCKGDQLTPAM